MKKEFLLGVGVTNATEDEILEYVVNSVRKTRENYYIVTPNPEMIVLAGQNMRFRNILNQARIAFADGIGLLWASKIFGKKLKERVTGTDFVESICRKLEGNHVTVGFLGGGEKVAEKAAECLLSRYPLLEVVFVSDRWREEGFTRAEELRIRKQELGIRGKIRQPADHNSLFIIPDSIDILFVAFGFPKQEEWMHEHLGKIPVRVMVGVGGAFDYISGRVPRAPAWVQKLGFEWLFRLVVQPWRIKRQLALLRFAFLVLREKCYNIDNGS